MLYKDNFTELTTKKYEALGEIEQAKQRAISELSGVDKCTLSRLREIICQYDKTEILVADKVNSLEKLLTSAIKNNEIEIGGVNTNLGKILAKAKINVFTTTAEMLSSKNLNVGEICATIGYHSADDNTGSFYMVSATGTANNYTCFKVGELYLTMIDTPTLKKIGCRKNDDITTALQFLVDNYHEVYFDYDSYYISSVEIRKAVKIYGNNVTLRVTPKAENINGFLPMFNILWSDCYIYNVNFHGETAATDVKPIGIYANKSITSPYWNNTNIIDCTFEKCYAGVYHSSDVNAYTSNWIIENADIGNCEVGIFLQNVTFANIKNTIFSNTKNVVLENVVNSFIRGCFMISDETGIELHKCCNNIIDGNSISSSGENAILIVGSANDYGTTHITANTIRNTTDYAIKTSGNYTPLIVTENSINECTKVIYFAPLTNKLTSVFEGNSYDRGKAVDIDSSVNIKTNVKAHYVSMSGDLTTTPATAQLHSSHFDVADKVLKLSAGFYLLVGKLVLSDNVGGFTVNIKQNNTTIASYTAKDTKYLYFTFPTSSMYDYNLSFDVYASAPVSISQSGSYISPIKIQ